MIIKNESLKETFIKAFENYRKKNFKVAESLCYKILSIDENHFDSTFLLSNIHAANNDFVKVKELLSKVAEIQPKNTSVINNLGNAYRELGKLNEAINFYNKVLQIDPKHSSANYNLGIAFYRKKKLKDAKNYFEKTIEFQPNFALAHFNLGNLQVEFKEYKEAKISYQKVIDLRPDFASAYNNCGLLFRLTGDYENAVKFYKKTIEIDPKHAGAYNNLGRAYTELGDFKKAMHSHEMGTKLEPENLYHFFYLNELKNDYLDTKLITKIKKIIEKKDQSKINLVYGNFLKARYENKKKNYQKEFEHLLLAHSNYFDHKKDKFELGLKYCFDDVLKISNNLSLNKSNAVGKNKLKPIFIVGVPRSGSTLVEKIIGSGKQNIAIGEETAILENFINDKILEKQSTNLGEIDIIRKDLINQYENKKLINKKNNFLFTDKSLNNFFYIGFIKDIFPEAKIINCKRNTLSSIISILQNNLTELSWAHNLENIFKYFNNYFQIIGKFKKTYPNFIYDLEFEKFTDDPEIESKKLMKFCDVPWDKKCLQYYKRKDIISKTTSYKQIRKAVYKHHQKKYLPYKIYLNKYGEKYPWFN